VPNDNHDDRGRFASGSGGGAAEANTSDTGTVSPSKRAGKAPSPALGNDDDTEKALAARGFTMTNTTYSGGGGDPTLAMINGKRDVGIEIHSDHWRVIGNKTYPKRTSFDKVVADVSDAMKRSTD
jgi:hypothetical protein